MEHLKRLVEWEREAIHFKRVPSGPYCKHVHGKNCTQCVTCHFCRQKWASPKTFCPCANSGRKGLVGGEQRGAWCQKCLEGRMGEDFKATME